VQEETHHPWKVALTCMEILVAPAVDLPNIMNIDRERDRLLLRDHGSE
jgi:hypothetical protein